MKLSQSIEYNKRNIFIQKLCRKLGRETSFRPPFILKKWLIWSKSNWSAAWFQYFSIALNFGYNKNNLHKTLDYWSRDILSFNFPGKGLYTTFCVWFFKKNVSYVKNVSDSLYFSRYWEICVLKLIINQAVTSQNLKLFLSF